MIASSLSEQEVKLSLVQSIAKSQEALARILDSIADITETSEDASKLLRDNVKVLTSYQISIAQMMCGVRLNRQYYGTPTMPWINEALDPAPTAARGVEEEDNRWPDLRSGQLPAREGGC